MKLLLGLVVGTLVMGCSGRAPRAPASPASGAASGWFCQMNASNDGWDCVQDAELARDPRPQRLPTPAPPPAPTRPLQTEPERMEPVPRRDPEPPMPNSGDGAAAPPAQSSATRAEAGTDESAPAYVRLAYRPPRPMALTELPPDLYAVQLVAMSSKPALERYVEQEGITDVSAARVERNGKLFYVLILGIYENANDAQRAVASLPAEVAESAPWIRPLGSLQAAMMRADDLAGSTRY
ncbi:MAG: SPOR domain-containing protein [Pseudomonadales bacterium]